MVGTGSATVEYARL